MALQSRNRGFLLRFMSIKAGEMARRLGISRMHVGRLAKVGAIPGARRTKGGHWFWIETEILQRQLSEKEYSQGLKRCLAEREPDALANKAVFRMLKAVPRLVNAYEDIKKYWPLLGALERTFVVRDMEKSAAILTEMRRNLPISEAPPASGLSDRARSALMPPLPS